MEHAHTHRLGDGQSWSHYPCDSDHQAILVCSCGEYFAEVEVLRFRHDGRDGCTKHDKYLHDLGNHHHPHDGFLRQLHVAKEASHNHTHAHRESSSVPT